VNAAYGWRDIASLERLLITPAKADSTIFVAWEHLELQKLVRSIMNKYGHHVTVPAWPTGDYDTLFVLDVTYSGRSISARFHRQTEGLNNLPGSCP